MLKLIPYFGGKTIDYGKEIITVINELSLMGIKVSCIVGDNLKPQKMALCQDYLSSIQQTSDSLFIKSILYYQCAAHTLALAIQDCFKHEMFGTLQNSVVQLAKKLNGKEVVNSLKLHVLQYINTR